MGVMSRLSSLAAVPPKAAHCSLRRAALTSARERGRLMSTHTGAQAAPPPGADAIGAGIGRMSNMVVTHGKGSWIWNTDGERYLDFASGIGVTGLGHCHPEVTAAVHAQVDRIWHAQVNITHHEQQLELTRRLCGLMPEGSGLDTMLYVTTGAEAVEAAVKLARHATGKPNLIVFQGSYHGRTLLTGAMTTSKTIFRARYGPSPAGIFVAPFPYAKFGGLSTEQCLAQLELLMLTQTTPEETAAVVIEPVLGEGGYVPAPLEFLLGIRAFCDRHGLLLVADEVQTGFGRTGDLFAIQQSGVHPDMLVFAKGVASGMPLAGLASRRALTDTQPAGSQGGTYAGNAIACAAANATIEVMTRDGGALLDNVRSRGEQLRRGLKKIQESGPLPIADVRGRGLMIGLELGPQVPKGTASLVSKAALSHGLVALSTGAFDTMRLVPPLTVSEEECDQALAMLEAALKDVAKDQ